MDNAINHTDVLPSVEKVLEKKPRKKKEMSDFRILPGSKKLLELAENVRKSLAELQQFDETVAMIVQATGKSETEVRAMLKNPDGFSNVLELRKSIRLALMRPEVSHDGLFLARIAHAIAPALKENDLMVSRTKGQKSQEANEGVTE